MYKCNSEAPSRNHRYFGKAVSITYSEYLFVALGIQQAMRMHHITICGLSGYSIFFYIFSLKV